MAELGSDIKFRRELREAGMQSGRFALARVKMPESIEVLPVRFEVVDWEYASEITGRMEAVLWDPFIDGDLRSSQGCMLEFVETAGKEDRKVRAFIEKWGPLGIEIRYNKSESYEALETYREYAEIFRSILLLSLQIREKEVEAMVLRQVLEFVLAERLPKFEPQEEAPEERNTRAQRMLSAAIAMLLETAQIKPMLTFERGHPEFIVQGAQVYPLFGMLVLELVATITSGAYLCGNSKCGKLFTEKTMERELTRKPRQDRPAFCSDDCRQEAERKRKADFSTKKRAEKRPE